MKLYDYQERVKNEALDVLRRYGIVYIMGMPRTGKTPISLSVVRQLHEESEANLKNARECTSLLLTRRQAMPSIEKDIKAVFGAKFGQIDLFSYHSIHKLEPKAYNCIILDEAHTVGAYPKANKMQKQISELFKSTGARAILLSGTPNIESGSQLFHQFRITHKLFTEYSNFYKWFKTYGIPKQIMVRGRLVNDYREVNTEMLNKAVSPFCITVTQDDAGFKVKSELIPVKLENHSIVEFERLFMRDHIYKFEDFTVVSDGAASALSKVLQACGGTIIDDEEYPHILPEYLDPLTKFRKIISLDYGKLAIFTNFIEERRFIQNNLSTFGKTTSDIDEFRDDPKAKYFVGSIESYCEGVDLSTVENCAMVIYSLSWRGKTLMQIMERQNNKRRENPIKIYVLMIRDTLEEDLYTRVAIEKKNFNSTFYKEMSRTKY